MAKEKTGYIVKYVDGGFSMESELPGGKMTFREACDLAQTKAQQSGTAAYVYNSKGKMVAQIVPERCKQ